MPWARFDDRFPSNRKVRLISDRAFRLYVSAVCWSAENLTDGFIGESELRLVADVRGAKAAAAELVERGLWTPSERVRAAVASSSSRVHDVNLPPSRRGRVAEHDAPDDTTVSGWEIHDYHDYNPTAEQVRTERQAKTARQQRWRDKQKGDETPPEPPAEDPDVDASTDESPDASRDGVGDAAPRARVPGPARPGPSPPKGGEGVCAPTGSRPRADKPHTHIARAFEPSSESLAWAGQDGHTERLGGDSALAAVTAAFVDWHTAKGTRAADADALWRKWVREQRAAPAAAQQGAFLIPLPGQGQAPSKTQQQRNALAVARERARQEGKLG